VSCCWKASGPATQDLRPGHLCCGWWRSGGFGPSRTAALVHLSPEVAAGRARKTGSERRLAAGPTRTWEQLRRAMTTDNPASVAYPSRMAGPRAGRPGGRAGNPRAISCGPACYIRPLKTSIAADITTIHGLLPPHPAPATALEGRGLKGTGSLELESDLPTD